jgi:cell division protein FtsQ
LPCGLKCLMTMVLLSLLGMVAIFIYDFIVQTPFFNIGQIDIAGNKQASREEILKLAELDKIKNIFELNTGVAEKQIASHPWIQSALLKRQLPSGLLISIVEHEALAIVNIGNTAIVINSMGQPFKEYIPESDRLDKTTVIKGIELTTKGQQYLFSGPVFESVIQFLKSNKSWHIQEITSDDYIGITVISENFHRLVNEADSDIIPIKLGFAGYEVKLKKAKLIYDYIGQSFTDRTINTMDLSDIEKAFVRTTLNNTPHK